QDLLALTRALTHLADRLAWLATLRAPWCGLTLADLHALAGNPPVSPRTSPPPGGEEATVWEAMNDDARVGRLSAGGRTRLERLRAVLRAAIDHRCRGPLRGRVAGVWYALGGPACVEDATDLEDAEIYFDYLEQHEAAGEISDPLAFEEGLAKLYALPDLEADEALQIMTIHKAKGLEFDTVIVPGLGRSPRNDDRKLFLWMEQPRPVRSSSPLSGRGEGNQTAPVTLDGGEAGAEGDVDLLLAPIHETGADSDPIYAWLEKLDARKRSFEDERLLYVASTRARHRLHLLGGTYLASDDDGVIRLGSPTERTLLGKLWPVVEPVYAMAAKQALESPSPLAIESGFSIGQALRRLPPDWALPAAPPQVPWKPPPDIARAQDDIEFSWAGETARHVGSVVHRWLQRIADDELRSWDAARVEALRAAYRQELAGRGVTGGDLEAAIGRVAAALAHAVTDKRGCWLLGPQPDACNERRITAVIGGERVNLIIDRIFLGADGKRWIVDYKTSSHEGADVEDFLDRERERYRMQLTRYASAVGDRGAMLGLYFPLLHGWREWNA
ncbi:MAG TPA: 3'-5' exonuclease, partial [Burkholderiales bacterium]|nr:3'-5' exonuclease [Burkholderiales bacterium]